MELDEKVPGETKRAAGQSSLLSEKALFRIETQLKSTTDTQPNSPAKNMNSRTYLLQSISVKFITTTDALQALPRQLPIVTGCGNYGQHRIDHRPTFKV